MKYREIENILSAFSTKFDESFDIPTNKDWNNLSKRFGTEFDNNFISYGFRHGIVSYVEFLFVVVPSLSQCFYFLLMFKFIEKL